MNTHLSVNGVNGLWFGLPNEFLQVVILAMAVAQLMVALMLAIAVKLDAERKQEDGSLFLIPPWLWFAVVLLSGGYLGGLGYWVIHYSALREQREGAR